MDDDSKHVIQNWGDYFRSPPLKGNLGLQLMSNVGDVWYNNNSRESSKMVHLFQNNNHHQHSQSYEPLLPETSAHSFQMQVEVPIAANALDVEPVNKRSKKIKRTKKAKTAKEESLNTSGRGRSKKSMDMVINGIDLDVSGIPTPVCTCTGQSQQCYRWGAGGWQSACCTSSISLHPLPMSSKRRGARIAGRKMSQGAFKKVLENLAGEGEDLSSPIDLKPFWAKHGTNKFVTIR